MLAFAWACISEGLTSLRSGFDCAHPPCLGCCVQAEKKAKQREKEKERKRAAAEKKAKAAEGARAAAEAEVTTAAAEAAALAARCVFVCCYHIVSCNLACAILLFVFFCGCFWSVPYNSYATWRDVIVLTRQEVHVFCKAWFHSNQFGMLS